MKKTPSDRVRRRHPAFFCLKRETLRPTRWQAHQKGHTMVKMPFPILRCGASLLVAATLSFAADPVNLNDLRRGFERPPDDARIMVRWWWFG
ncbi:MAG TPA: hypothetical protein VNV86_00115, partial [Candidatus Acidoferrum sp.]|nr:hypothetical protein [Candidatus Acidoferrum sp.]